MICPKCGYENRDGDSYCALCGETIESQHNIPPYQDSNTQTFEAPPTPEVFAAESQSKSSLVMGILSIALCWLAGIPGIILGALAISNAIKARLVLNESHYYYWNALAGIVTGAIGLAFSLISVIIWIVVVLGWAAFT